MSKGRKPVPTQTLKLRGTYRPDRRPANEPQPRKGRMTCPSHLCTAAKREFTRLTKELTAAGILTQVDRAAVAVIATAYARWVDAETHLAELGPVVKSPSGYPIQNPWLSVANKAVEQLHKYMTEFGMTPSSRTKINVGKSADFNPLDGNAKPNPMDRFFKRQA